MCRDRLITNSTMRQSTVRRRLSTARGARCVSTPARGLSHVGYCARAVVVFDMVDVSSVVLLCFFLSSAGEGRRSLTSRERRVMA